jgi:hypothetical protein
VPKVYEFEDALAAAGAAKASVRGILLSLSSILTEAQLRGLVVAQNVVRARGKRKKQGNGRATTAPQVHDAAWARAVLTGASAPLSRRF